ncbi:hypothetical protein COU18_02790 [Candidatus Kaiserbacteria bacterium CG10_big_fil_rev_8_21_14_0_10_51_14]|uniref:Uncharacterized protein n=1 Tax=Candidatus Kaiserbacteria bacterium CG10_big_fil_rev_8_21_14_0_10_51_14 TaxID=1974610 RepID=A0A2H0UCT6_9BACT|nr:MAG: hypothetical protein COU18_02790 [Candidatus Kaiserbacteria bacterium CG10_big_fil_rev_8_21_14_0_10_51_14]
MVWRLVWFACAAIALSYGSYLVAGSVIQARATGSYEPTIVRDVINRDAHHLSGMIMVPSPCDQLTVRTQTLSSTTYMLNFRTWREPSMDCADEITPRAFRTILFATPTNVKLGATLNGAGLSIVVLPLIQVHSTSTE